MRISTLYRGKNNKKFKRTKRAMVELRRSEKKRDVRNLKNTFMKKKTDIVEATVLWWKIGKVIVNDVLHFFFTFPYFKTSFFALLFLTSFPHNISYPKREQHNWYVVNICKNQQTVLSSYYTIIIIYHWFM